MKVRALLTGGFAAALAVAAFAVPGSAVAAAPPHSAAAPHRPAGSDNTRPLSKADFAAAAGGIALGKVAGIIPARGGAVDRAGAVAAAAASCSEPDCNMTYHGGPVQHAARIYVLFWGPKWNTDATHKAVKNYLISFYKGLGEGPNDSWSTTDSQYGDKSGRPTFGKSLFAGSHVVTTKPPKSVTLTDLGNEAATAAQNIFKIKLANAHNAQIVIAAQSGTCFAASGGVTFAGNCGVPPTQTTVGYCGFHNFDFDPSNASVYLPWTNLPFQLDAKQGCGENFINTGSRGEFDGFTVTGGHEAAETITDPKESAWFDSNDTISGGEIADKCAWAGSAWNQNPPDPAADVALRTGSFGMQSLWSNSKQACVLSGKLPFKVTPLGNQTTTIGKAVSLQVSAATTPATALTFKATGLPGGITISKAGRISGTPNVTAGTFTVKVSVSYYGGIASFSFTWRVASAPGQIKGLDAKCVDDAGGHTGNGTKIDLFTCASKAQQMITFTSTSELQVLGKCITGTTTALLQPCKLAKTQLWTRHANGEYVLKSSGKCLTAPSKNNGTGLTLAACKNTASQHWSLP